MFRMRNGVREYAWGSGTAIARLQGREPDGTPQAELWMGAHPDGSSAIVVDGRTVHLDEWLGQDAERVLGAQVIARFGSRLPYLLKVLAADAPLSLQVHPSADQAERGFAAEEAAGLAHSARERRYKDPFHKPELILAVTRFEALCGLRPRPRTRELLAGLAVTHPDWDRLLGLLDSGAEPDGLRGAFGFLLDRRADRSTLVEAVVEASRQRLLADTQWQVADRTVLDLAAAYPGDPGVVLSLFLNRLTLEPGEALYLPAGNLHAYLSGLGIEIMASSDNVLRAGLTPKFMDVDELMAVVDFHPGELPYVVPEVDGPVARYRPGAAEFELTMVHCAPERITLGETGPRIVFALAGGLRLHSAAGDTLHLTQGESAFVPGSDGPIDLSAEESATAVIASVPMA